MSDTDPPIAEIRPRRFSFVWLLPMLALMGVGYFVYLQAARERGPTVSIRFSSADGLEPGAAIRHRGVTVGVVRTVSLSDDLDAVVATAEISPSAVRLTTEGTQFWIVRPEVSLSRVAGLETILGPRYIAVRPNTDPSAALADSFIGLGSAPALPASAESDALVITLVAPRTGPLAPGSPVLFRDIPVGVVRTIGLGDDASHAEIVAAIDPRYSSLVRTNSRFWFASGVGVDWGLFSGLSVRTDSIDALLNGAVAFATPDKPGEIAGGGEVFELAAEADKDWLRWEPALPLRAANPP